MSRAHLSWLAAAFLAAPAAADEPKRYAVLIGVNEYDHPRLPGLRFSVNDAVELARVLKPAGYEVTLLADTAGQKPTKANIEAAVRGVLLRCRPGDTVVVTFSGHGLQFKGTTDAFFCPSDARPSLNGKDSLVSLSKLYLDMNDSFAGVKLLLVDACRNDPGEDRFEALGMRGVDADSAPNPPQGVAAFFSCSAGEQAVEHREFKHGVFFHYVLEGLRGKARDGDGEITFNSLAGYVAKNVSRQVAVLTRGERKQSPNQKADLSGASPVLVAGTTADIGKPSDRGLVLYAKKEFAAAADPLRAGADAGDSRAMYALGRMYDDGLGVAKDDQTAFQWYMKAAEAGDERGMNNVGVMYEQGLGVAANQDEAVKWYRRAVAAGSKGAVGNLARYVNVPAAAPTSIPGAPASPSAGVPNTLTQQQPSANTRSVPAADPAVRPSGEGVVSRPAQTPAPTWTPTPSPVPQRQEPTAAPGPQDNGRLGILRPRSAEPADRRLIPSLLPGGPFRGGADGPRGQPAPGPSPPPRRGRE